MKYSILILLFGIPFCCFSQITVQGIVKNNEREALVNATIFAKEQLQYGTVTDLEGKFSITLPATIDTLVIVYLGYKTQQIALTGLALDQQLQIVMELAEMVIADVVVVAQNPIAEQFSVVVLNKLDIYLNPMSQGDPLKAITLLPASTTDDESANPSFRGSAADKSRVVLNGVPIYQPVRNSDVDGVGTFSIFNTEMIDKQYVYASNPPLTYGNIGAGLVEIETSKNLNRRQLQVAISMASMGVFAASNLKPNTFFQIFSNYQFPGLFLQIHRKSLASLQDFYTKDFGLNVHTHLNPQITSNTFLYGIDEGYNYSSTIFTHSGVAVANKKRAFLIQNIKYSDEQLLLSWNGAVDFSTTQFMFGNLHSRSNNPQTYQTLDAKWAVSEQLTLQTGITYNFQQYRFNDSLPVFYYALSSNSPNFNADATVLNHQLETYCYLKWGLNNKWSFSTGIRKNFPNNQQRSFWSYQFSSKIQLTPYQSLLLSAGKYYNYTVPSVLQKEFILSNSQQVALDYTIQKNNQQFKGAIYYKQASDATVRSNFSQFGIITTWGLELYWEKTFKNYFILTLANTFLEQHLKVNSQSYRGDYDYNYFIKATLQYQRPAWFNLSVAFIARPGNFYTPISGAIFDTTTSFYVPNFEDSYNSAQYDAYQRLDFSFSKMIGFKKMTVLTFLNLNNVFNWKNPQTIVYNRDYSATYFDNYQLRTVYAGVVWQW